MQSAAILSKDYITVPKQKDDVSLCKTFTNLYATKLATHILQTLP